METASECCAGSIRRGRLESRTVNESSAPHPFRTLRPWLMERFGRPVHRVALDAGSTCPNRDGTQGFGGCVYCDVEGSGTGALRSGSELTDQLRAGIARVAQREPDAGVIAYFQSYSNTYVETARLREVLSILDAFLDRRASVTPVVAVSIATRPDTISDEALRVLEELARRVDVWLELGLEAASDEILRDIHRYHTVAEFEDAVRRAKQAGLLTVGHAILGLPQDGRSGAQRTAHCLAASGVEGVKVHNLLILRRTQLEKAWRAGEITVLDQDTYVDWLADFVERLRPEQVLHRVSADSVPREELAPLWNAHANRIRDRLAGVLHARESRQGARTQPDAAAVARAAAFGQR